MTFLQDATGISDWTAKRRGGGSSCAAVPGVYSADRGAYTRKGGLLLNQKKGVSDYKGPYQAAGAGGLGGRDGKGTAGEKREAFL
ncbi:hypothetical protein AAFF_G00235630 [Aldrovandia affinis]|uniref:Uncharacterized protein n=1 Tax=Aldrovandia affinis TaxID=143900 RepID=A0AAD7WUD8_9TELE|nr:hypothetical protein AAFF_G00235630 [Aldrovandia affinis]